jgi:hypothetical protein
MNVGDRLIDFAMDSFQLGIERYDLSFSRRQQSPDFSQPMLVHTHEVENCVGLLKLSFSSQKTGQPRRGLRKSAASRNCVAGSALRILIGQPWILS